MAQSLGGAFVIDMGIQFVGWAFASALRTEKFYDLCGSLAFASTALATFASGARAPRQALLTGMVCAWTGTLGIFLLARVLRDGGDSRFDEVKTKPGLFAMYWALQGVWVWVTALPCFLINGASNQSALHAGDYVAFAVWLVGVVTETVADWQKRRFKSDPANAGRFIDVGLWSLSRHPNYFGVGSWSMVRPAGSRSRRRLAGGLLRRDVLAGVRHVPPDPDERRAHPGKVRGREVGDRGQVPRVQATRPRLGAEAPGIQAEMNRGARRDGLGRFLVRSFANPRRSLSLSLPYPLERGARVCVSPARFAEMFP